MSPDNGTYCADQVVSRARGELRVVTDVLVIQGEKSLFGSLAHRGAARCGATHGEVSSDLPEIATPPG